MQGADLGEFSNALSGLIVKAKGFDIQKENNSLVNKTLSLFSNKKERIMAKFRTVEAQITESLIEIEKKQEQQQLRIKQYEQLYEQAHVDYMSLELDIKQGEEALVNLKEHLATQPTNNVSFELNSLKDTIDKLEKRVYDLKLAQMNVMNSLPELKLMTQNAISQIDKIQNIKLITIPAWKRVFTLYLLNKEQQETIAFTNAIDDMTNDLIRKNSDMLKDNVVNAALSKNRGVIDMDTLVYSQNKLFEAMDELEAINNQAKIDRKTSTALLLTMKQKTGEKIG
jgi:uncharacterized protein YaaN involved in tellurite resistance